MNDGNPSPWQVVRQDENGHRYRIGRCATRAEAQRLIRRLEEGAGVRPADSGRYLVERVERADSAPR
ncbi:SPOR domain-containing protein [Streptomyces sp. ST2-7A]|uniref:SPOR domain-containing protein n=1 Tax=Streptomyces sp. ST2-7A TaxID=2907214 RepID=UPI001F23E350|nr:SPOR domain-containing protein [Streptomyces sp. ST2-7A]MCE7082139.1 SPOR domain-containing protein [Streptomyces sp. ST2-7A]